MIDLLFASINHNGNVILEQCCTLSVQPNERKDCQSQLLFMWLSICHNGMSDPKVISTLCYALVCINLRQDNVDICMAEEQSG